MRTIGGGRGARAVSTGVLALGAFAAALVVTVAALVANAPVIRIESEDLHLVVSTVDGCVALLAVGLMVGRYRRSRSVRSLLLGAALAVLAGNNLVGPLLRQSADSQVVAWASHLLGTCGAILVMTGALLPGRRIARRAALVLLGSLATVVALLVGLLVAVERHLPPPVRTSVDGPGGVPAIAGHPVLLGLLALAAGCLLVAGLALTVQSRYADDVMLRWWAPACVFGAFARVHYVLVPSLYSEWFSTGDLLRSLCYLLFLVGAVREIQTHWRAQPGLAVAADRRRLARDLHDGVVQELGFIRSELYAVDDSALRGRIDGAAQRGLDEARAAIAALDLGAEEALEIQLRDMARVLHDRFGTSINIELDDSVHVTGEQAAALLRIAREATGNAIRHGGADRVRVGLVRDQGRVLLVVDDDGSGFDPSAPTSRGYGLTSMRDRAAGLPGSLDVRSAPGRGTRVAVTW